MGRIHRALQNRPVYLAGIGTALPENHASQEKTRQLAEVHRSGVSAKKLLQKIYGQVAVGGRYSVLSPIPQASQTFFGDFFNGTTPGTRERMHLFEKYAPILAHQASEEAMKAGGISPEDIGHLTSVSCTGFAAPGFDIAIIKSLALLPSVSRTHVGFMGCHGVFNALRVASALCAQTPRQDTLITSVELCSLHYRQNPTARQMLGNALFSDGAAAAVVSSKKPPSSRQIVAQGSFIVPDSEEAVTWRVGGQGFEMELSPKIRQLIKASLEPWLAQWLAAQRLNIRDIRSWAVHPGGPGVLDAVEEGLGLPAHALEISRKTLNSYGNMSSATILFILKKILDFKRPMPCVALGFGPGLAIEAALLT